jgi:hypothetical protein
VVDPSSNVQIGPRRRDHVLLVNLPALIFDAIANRLLVDVQTDVIHNFLRGASLVVSESASAEFSFLYTKRSSLTYPFKQSDLSRRIRLTFRNRRTDPSSGIADRAGHWGSKWCLSGLTNTPHPQLQVKSAAELLGIPTEMPVDIAQISS